MKTCPKCGLKHDDNVKNCDCGADLSEIISEEKKQKKSETLQSSKDAGFFSFDTMISPTLIKIIYVIGIIAIIIAAIVMIFSGGFLYGLGLIILGNLLWRIICESSIILFKIYDRLQ